MSGQNGAGLRRKPGSPISPEEGAFIVEYVERGYSVIAIAEKLERPFTTVQNWVRRNGIEYERQRAGPRRLPRIDKVVQGPPIRATPQVVQERVLSSARRNVTVAAVMREANVSRAVADRALGQTRSRGIPPGPAMRAIAGYATKAVESATGSDTNLALRDNRDWNNLVVDYGAEEVRSWVEKLEGDRRALAKLSRKLRGAVDRVESDTQADHGR